MGYIYQADVYCESCGDEICAKLRADGKAPEDEMETRSYDSNDFPKPADVEREESDCPQHCAKCGEFLRNPLTSQGYKYVQEALSRLPLSTSSLEWASWYEFEYWTTDDCGPLEPHQVPGWYSREAY